MQGYESCESFLLEMKKRAQLFINEFTEISESDKDLLVEGVDRSPAQMIAYQLGWLKLLQGWEQDEQAGLDVITPHPDYKWNQLGPLYQSFYENYRDCSLEDLVAEFQVQVEKVEKMTLTYTEEEFQSAGSRQWASSTPSNWPVWKWFHINTVAPFKSFRTKIRKWKKLRGEER